jgi:hypothetical protein
MQRGPLAVNGGRVPSGPRARPPRPLRTIRSKNRAIATVGHGWIHRLALAFRWLSMLWIFGRWPWIHILVNYSDQMGNVWIQVFILPSVFTPGMRLPLYDSAHSLGSDDRVDGCMTHA